MVADSIYDPCFELPGLVADPNEISETIVICNSTPYDQSSAFQIILPTPLDNLLKPSLSSNDLSPWYIELENGYRCEGGLRQVMGFGFIDDPTYFCQGEKIDEMVHIYIIGMPTNGKIWEALIFDTEKNQYTKTKVRRIWK
jgi:hypothetical protein